jgi:hypothetical protein
VAVSFIGGGNWRTQRKPLTLREVTTWAGLTVVVDFDIFTLLFFRSTYLFVLVISWLSVLLVEETGGPRENH